MLLLSNEIATFWLQIARRLPDLRQPDKLAFRFSDSFLDDIERDVSDSKGRFLKMMNKWRSIDLSHTWGPLWDTLFECRLGRAAETVLKQSENWQDSGKPREAISCRCFLYLFLHFFSPFVVHFFPFLLSFAQHLIHWHHGLQ